MNARNHYLLMAIVLEVFALGQTQDVWCGLRMEEESSYSNMNYLDVARIRHLKQGS